MHLFKWALREDNRYVARNPVAMKQVLARDGRTVLMVSHGEEQIERFCSRAILFDQGRLIASGSPAEIALRYNEIRAAAPRR